MGGTPELRRTLTLPQMIVYGVGTMVGGGFYALIGKVGGVAGGAVPAALAVAALVATLSALSFGELSGRFPTSAGEARYVEEGFGRVWLGRLVGLMVIATGVVSAATLCVAFVGFLSDLPGLADIPRPVALIAVAAALTGVAAWGVGTSVAVVAVITVIEVGGLIVVLAAGMPSAADVAARAHLLLPAMDAAAFSGVLSGAFLAFYAFIGFEDMVNMGEEVRSPGRTMPRAILWALIITAALYMAVATVAVLRVPLDELVGSATPLAVVAGGGALGTGLIYVSMLAGLNGALVQIVMAARVVFGLTRDTRTLTPLAVVHPARRTPVRATVLVGLIVAMLAIGFPLVTLAQVTSGVILAVFAIVQAALFRMKGRPDWQADADVGMTVPRWVAGAGAAVCVALLAFRLLG